MSPNGNIFPLLSLLAADDSMKQKDKIITVFIFTIGYSILHPITSPTF
jgi:hypothetical protein